MKTITIDGQKFEYQCMVAQMSHSKRLYFTNFYQGTRTFYRKKYIVFGEKIKKTKPNFAFRLDINIEDPIYSKNDVKEQIMEKLALLARIEEIKRGEIV